MAFNVNPLMAEYAGISPGLKAALSSAGQAPPMNAPAITPQMKADAQPVNAGPAPEIPGIHMPDAPVPQLGSPRMQDSINPILGTTHGDTLHRESLLQHGPTVDHIASRIEGSGFGQDHPVLGKILGDTAQVAGKIGDTALNIGGSLGIPAINTLARDIPGTTQNYNHELRGANANLTQDTTNAQKEAQTASENATAQHTTEDTAEAPEKATDAHAQSQATVGNLNSEAENRGKPKDAWKELAGYTGPKGEPLEINEGTGETRTANAPAGSHVTSPKESTPQQQTYDSLLKQGMTPVQAYEKIREKPGGTTINQGTWTLDEDKDGKPVLFNSKTGDTKAAPAGIQKSGTFAKGEAKTAPMKSALEYASDYGSRATHTGSGDEALMEKFFELAKPSTGFRMSQPQIDMLKNAQSWMGSLEAHLRHATTGTWFSDDQRNQIVGTMHDLAKSNGLEGEKNTSTPVTSPQRPAGVPENYVWNQQGNGGKGSWKAPQ